MKWLYLASAGALLVVLLWLTVALPSGAIISSEVERAVPAAAPVLSSSAGDPRYYDIGNPTLTDIWVDPVNGDDGNSGVTRAQALRTVTAAWSRIPTGTTLTTTGYRILLVAGVYPESSFPIYWESRYGTYNYPIVIQPADGSGTARLHGFINVYDTRYLYLLDLTMINGGDVLHCEQCDHLLVRGSVLDGGDRQAHETIKVNQSRYIYIESSDVSGSYENAIDFVAVQYGHIVDNRLHEADDWCIYLKGGSAYFRIEGNEIYDCGTGGFTAGQGSGFEFLVSPWLHYETYDIKFINNVIHDAEGAGMGVNGGYNILLAYNTLYRVGQRSHVIEVVFGLRTCDGDTARCGTNLAAGGWGTTAVGGEEPIPDRNVYIYNNIVYNPAGYQSQWQHFAIYGPRTPSSGSNIPSPARTDTNLQIRGNIIWNGPAGHPLGVEDSNQGCQPSNPTCNATQLRAENAINTVEPQLVNPAGGDFHPVPGGNVFGATTYSIPDFTWADAPTRPAVPTGDLSNAVPRDRDGNSRTSSGPPGAYVGATGTATPTPTVHGGPPTATPTPTITPSATLRASSTPGVTECVRDVNSNGIGDVVDIMATARDLPCQMYLPVVVGQWRRPWLTPTPSATFTASPTATPTPSATLRPSPTPTATSISGTTPPIVPVIDAAMKARLRAVYLAGQATGNRAAVFAKIGDSITESGSFLMDVGCGAETLGVYTDLAPVIAYFRSTTFPSHYTGVWCEVANSFTRQSASAVAGWSADYASDPAYLDPSLASVCPAPYNTPLRCELYLLRPSIALIMYGTNDLQRYNDLAFYRANLTRIVTETVAAGVIPVLSTIPPRLDSPEMGARVAPYNQAVIEVAQAQQIPLWNYWLALQGPEMINQGISEDGVHPNIFNSSEGANFTAEALRYGYNVRNLTAIQVLAKIKQVVMDDGSPDP